MLHGNHTLGREESRSGRFLDRNDYCKLHIIVHYVQTLMGPDFITLPIGLVGDDLQGKRLLSEMEEVGINLRFVRAVPGEQTLFSICFIYPDGSGGNLTIEDSACSKVSPALVREAEADFAALEGKGIGLAVPEVPMIARAELLELATRHSFFRAASFTSEEMQEVKKNGILTKVDLLAINMDEAAALAEVSARQAPLAVAEKVVRKISESYPTLQVSITAGRHGSWLWNTAELSHRPAYKAEAVSTTGAGDAHFSGILAGLASGLSLNEAHELGALTAALSVTSPHTISKEINRNSLKKFAKAIQAQLCAGLNKLLER